MDTIDLLVKLLGIVPINSFINISVFKFIIGLRLLPIRSVRKVA